MTKIQFYRSLIAVVVTATLWSVPALLQASPHHVNSANGRHHVNLVKPSQVQQNDDDSWYTPARSPGFHDDFGS
jgi:hypothetical protein